MSGRIYVILLVLVTLGLASASSAQDLLPEDNGIFGYHQAPRYRDSESHPLRFAAYIAHPAGWIAREVVFRPFSAFAGSTRFTRSFFGFREPYDFREQLCFYGADIVPDCRDLPPMNALAVAPTGEEEVEEAAMAAGERQVFMPDVNFQFDKSALTDLGRVACGRLPSCWLRSPV